MAILTAKQIWRRNPEPEPKQLGNRLNPAERENVRQALVYLVGRHPSRDAAVAAISLSLEALIKGMSKCRAQTYRLACIVARAADVPVEKILSGAWPGDRCPHCGGTGKRSQIVRGPT
jgi:hypothetical protein